MGNYDLCIRCNEIFEETETYICVNCIKVINDKNKEIHA